MQEDFTRNQRMLASAAAFAVFALLIAYVVTLVLGFLSLASALDPIGDPYFSILEVLIVVMAPLMVLVMVAVHGHSMIETRFYSLAALAFMTIMAWIQHVNCIFAIFIRHHPVSTFTGWHALPEKV